MNRYLLDTNMVSHLFRSHPMVKQRVLNAPMASLCISAITEGELRFGLAKRPEAKRLQLAVREFLQRVTILSWDSAAAERYGIVRADMERTGKTLAPLDLLIAVHALSTNATLVTNDHSFTQIDILNVEDWTIHV